MNKKIAVEDGINGLTSYLEKDGFQVVPLREGITADAYIITGMDENMTGNMTRAGEGFLINARGRQPEEILYDLHKHFQLMQ